MHVIPAVLLGAAVPVSSWALVPKTKDRLFGENFDKVLALGAVSWGGLIIAAVGLAKESTALTAAGVACFASGMAVRQVVKNETKS